MNRRAIQIITFLFVSVVFNGCTINKLRHDIKIMESMVAIGGRIVNHSPHQKPLTVLIYSKSRNQKQIRNFKIIDKGENFYAFIVPIGEYYIFAFEDANNNLVYDDGEYFGHYGKPDRISVTDLTPIEDLNIKVSRTEGVPFDFPTDVSSVKVMADIKTIATGTVTTLDNDIFSEENAKVGSWQPVTALYRFGAGVYFLEPYDPNKIPILFVHGASGSPQNFRFLSENIDLNRFQPWFFHYPSGFPLKKISRFLNSVVTYLHDEYQFDSLYVTAHSMGGLVSRSFIKTNIHEDKNTYIKLFVSISSPFGGLKTAHAGVNTAPTAIPSWHDLVPGSEFIGDIFSKSLKPKTDYYLLFSHKGNHSIVMDNNDGSVTLRSQLDLRAQKDAVKTWGFDEGHVSILSSEEVLEIYRGILEKKRKN